MVNGLKQNREQRENVSTWRLFPFAIGLQHDAYIDLILFNHFYEISIGLSDSCR